MPLQHYGVLRGTIVRGRAARRANLPHYQLLVQAGATPFRVAVNIRGRDRPSDLLFAMIDHYQHPITGALLDAPPGFTRLSHAPGGLALDYVRANLVDRAAMRPLPASMPGPDNDLADLFTVFVRRAMRTPGAEIFAFGQRWGPEEGRPDPIFGFAPGNGIHDVHMNQGSAPAHAHEDGPWQDGAIFLHFPGPDAWVAVFLAFQSQVWHTEAATGHPHPAVPEAGPAPAPGPSEPDALVRIAAAMLAPPAGEPQTVTLLNTTPRALDLTGWHLVGGSGTSVPLGGIIDAGATLRVALPEPLAAGAGGGTITLRNTLDLKVDGVSYTAAQVARPGWTVVF